MPNGNGYYGNVAINDVAQAVKEAKEAGVGFEAVCIEPRGNWPLGANRGDITHMFNFQVVVANFTTLSVPLESALEEGIKNSKDAIAPNPKKDA